MPDFNQLDQQVMLSKALFFLPAPARATFAQGLFDLGVRIHPELATKEVLTTGAPGLVNHSPRRLVSIKSQQEGMDFLRQFKPEMAAKIDAAQTPAAKQALLDQIRASAPEVIAQAEQKLAAADPEDLEGLA